MDLLEVISTGGKSKRGFAGKMGYFKGFGYTFNNVWTSIEKGQRLRWKCNFLGGKACDAAVITNEHFKVDMDHFGKNPPVHDHPPVQISTKLAVAAMADVKEIAKLNSELTAGQVINRVRSQVNVSVLDKLPSKHAQEIAVSRARMKAFNAVANPTNIFDLGEIPEEFAFRDKRDSFGGANIREEWLQSDNGHGNQRFLIFARPKFLEMLGACDQWFMDSTSGVLPEVFGETSQLLTVHARYRETHHTIPCIYVVMQDKKQDTYRRVFVELQRLTNYSIPRQIYVDFELAMINAAQLVFPGVEICACLFHLYRSWRRHLGQLGLQRVIDASEQLGLQYAMIKALAFVPVDEVDAAYTELVRHLHRPTFDPFLDYLTEYYVGVLDPHTGVRGDGKFPRKFWNVYTRTLLDDPRTNNSVEGYHHKLKIAIKPGHTTLWSFICKLRDFEETIYSDYRQWINGQIPPGRKLWKNIKARKLYLVRQWGLIARMEYLRSISSSLDDT